jgi:uncharacterized protein YbbK (DUF523 family)
MNSHPIPQKSHHEFVLVSACLAGFPCRYDGRAKTDDRVVALVLAGQAVPVCPEQLGGLTTPRRPAEVVAGRVVDADGDDVTDAFRRGAEATLVLAQRYGCTRAILKANSPSCGCGRVYDGTFTGALVPGNGVTAELLSRHGMAVSTEADLGPAGGNAEV